MNERVDVRELILQRFQYGKTWLLTDALFGHALHNAEFEVGRDVVFQALRCTLRTDFLGQSVDTQEQTVSYPADWWQMFKQRFFPYWLVKRFPLNYRRQKVHFEARVLYPQAPPMLGEPVVKLYTTLGEQWDD